MLKSKKKLCRLLLGLAAAVTAAAAGAFGASAYDESTNVLTEYEHTAESGCVFVGVEGNFATDVQAAIDRVNAIRLEACQEGVPDPRNSSRKLTTADYVPIKWSADLEKLAKIRAVEATVVFGHIRATGDGCFALDYVLGIRSNGEVLAWNWGSTMVPGINQFYSEKTDWVNRNSSAVTGHYTQMIDPSNTYMGLGCFINPTTTGYPSALCGRFYSRASSESRSSLTSGVMPLQVKSSEISDVTLKQVSGGTTIAVGNEAGFELRGKVSPSAGGRGWSCDALLYKATWNSSDTSVATVDKYGRVTGKAVGTATVTGTFAGQSKSVTVTVTESIASCKITIPYSSYTYRGRGIKPTVTVKTSAGKTLTKGTDYTVSYSDNTNAGTAKITVNGMGQYGGSQVKTFTVKPLGLSSSYAKITIPYSAYTYTGSVIKPEATVKFKNGSVIPSDDYSVSYSNNIKVGMATMTVKAKGGNTSGSYTKTFVVKPAKNAIKSITTTKGAFKITWTKGTAGTVGYQVLYSTDKNFKNNVHSYTSTNLSDLSENFSKVPKSGETWYVKVRSFYTKDGKTTSTRYGNYSSVKIIKVK